jgi:hypothetical protein
VSVFLFVVTRVSEYSLTVAVHGSNWGGWAGTVKKKRTFVRTNRTFVLPILHYAKVLKH